MISLSDKISPHLPFLRRFARALAGSQERGDECVAGMLQNIIADPETFQRSSNLRVALYRTFLRHWHSQGDEAPGIAERDGATAGAMRTLEAVSPMPREAFLLTAVEGFTAEDTALILNTDLSGVLRLLDEAGGQIAAQMATNVLIIEDEPLVAMDLENIVTSLGHRVTGTARTHAEAVAAVAKHRPGLVLADIQLADGSSGLQAVNEILQADKLPVVFITAFPERLLTGTRPEPVFLITKPFRVDAVKAVLSQVLFFRSTSKAGATRT
jgi:CheY-like chemotaxis protein/DNA-directed RNA polymerase specialized sigma24 family protein